MGASTSKIEEDKALQLCRERKKFVRQALDGRCALAAAHVNYIQSLKSTGTALRKFVQPEAHVESSLYTSTNATPEPLALAGRSLSPYSFSSPTVSQPVDAVEHISSSSSPPSSSRFHVNHMRFRGSFAKKVEEKPPVAVTETITSLNIPQDVTAQSHERAHTTIPDTSSVDHENSPVRNEDSPWDYFGLFHPIDNHLSSDQGRGVNGGFENDDDMHKLTEDEGMPELEDEDDKLSSSQGSEGSQESDDEFDDPSSETLVRSFKNLNREVTSHVAPSASPALQTEGSATPESEFLNGEKLNSPRMSPLGAKSSESASPLRAKSSESASPLRAKSSEIASPLRFKSSETATMNYAKMMPMKDDGIEHKVIPKDFFSSMRDVENIFIKASDSGREVPKKLEANKLHFRPIIPGQRSGSTSSMLLKACFSCGEDPSQVPAEPVQPTTKYLTWHRTISSRSASSRNLLGAHPLDDAEDNDNPFESFCMNSGSHASTLDRLHAWERKLYDEVKASQVVRRQYDMKCKILREQESRAESAHKVDKTRSAVKDLHSRIRVAIHRIHSISKRIEELRDQELEPQLEELIEGLFRMWEVMYDCHRLQLHIITIAYSNSGKISVHSESHRHYTSILEDELHNLSSSFTKWIASQKSYVLAINNWLNKCVSLPQLSARKKRQRSAPDLKKTGPPIYTACGLWLEMLGNLPVKEVADTTKGLARDVSRFLPRQEKNQGKKAAESNGALNDDEGFEDWNMGYVQFRSSLTIFLGQLSSFAERSMNMYGDLQKSIQDAKRNYEHLMSQP